MSEQGSKHSKISIVLFRTKLDVATFYNFSGLVSTQYWYANAAHTRMYNILLTLCSAASLARCTNGINKCVAPMKAERKRRRTRRRRKWQKKIGEEKEEGKQRQVAEMGELSIPLPTLTALLSQPTTASYEGAELGGSTESNSASPPSPGGGHLSSPLRRNSPTMINRGTQLGIR